MIQRPVGRDAKEPRAEREALERSDGSPRREERILDDVLGIRCGANDAQGVPIERSLLSSSEVLESSRVAATRTLDEMLNIAFRSRAQGAVNAHSITNPLKSVPGRVEERKKKVVVIGEDDEP